MAQVVADEYRFMPSSSAASASSASACVSVGGAAPPIGSALFGRRPGSAAGAGTSPYMRRCARGGTRTGSVSTSVRIWWHAATSARCMSDARHVSSTCLSVAESSALSRYAATVLGSAVSSWSVASGVASPRRRVTFLMRSTSNFASSLAATFFPRLRVSVGSSVSSMYARSVRSVSRGMCVPLFGLHINSGGWKLAPCKIPKKRVHWGKAEDPPPNPLPEGRGSKSGPPSLQGGGWGVGSSAGETRCLLPSSCWPRCLPHRRHR